MPRRVFVAPKARDDIARMRRWYSQPGAGARAKARAKRIAAAIREIGRAPLMWPRGDEPGTRERVVEEHTIVYRVENDVGDAHLAGDVEIVRVFGPGQERQP